MIIANGNYLMAPKARISISLASNKRKLITGHELELSFLNMNLLNVLLLNCHVNFRSFFLDTQILL